MYIIHLVDLDTQNEIRLEDKGVHLILRSSAHNKLKKRSVISAQSLRNSIHTDRISEQQNYSKTKARRFESALPTFLLYRHVMLNSNYLDKYYKGDFEICWGSTYIKISELPNTEYHGSMDHRHYTSYNMADIIMELHSYNLCKKIHSVNSNSKSNNEWKPLASIHCIKLNVHALHIINSRKNNYIDVIHIHNQQPENIQPNGLSVEYKNRFGNSNKCNLGFILNKYSIKNIHVEYCSLRSIITPVYVQEYLRLATLNRTEHYQSICLRNYYLNLFQKHDKYQQICNSVKDVLEGRMNYKIDEIINMTNPNPLHLFVCKSLITFTLCTAPNGPNSCHNTFSSVSGAKLYTNMHQPDPFIELPGNMEFANRSPANGTALLLLGLLANFTVIDSVEPLGTKKRDSDRASRVRRVCAGESTKTSGRPRASERRRECGKSETRLTSTCAAASSSSSSTYNIIRAYTSI
ncbi:hypothetical protein AGLY_014290 [Aphis glycines]|uniref:Uncharacterized protein n=1 Tax=Aphis glycines TaxID=307491 RepID=A0A6G0T3Y2_APHGL|nr:hypothetical protein AGLY_014290 [Aphis glycines]